MYIKFKYLPIIPSYIATMNSIISCHCLCGFQNYLENMWTILLLTLKKFKTPQNIKIQTQGKKKYQYKISLKIININRK